MKSHISYLTAGALVILTLAVFRSAQTLGPESAVKRFIDGVSKNDIGWAQGVVAQSLESPSGSVLIGMARFADGPIVIADRQNVGSHLIIVTHPADKPTTYDSWYLVRSNGRWLIDAYLTAAYRTQSMMPIQ